MVTTHLLTAEDLWAMPEDARGELLDGELLAVNPVGPEHRYVTGRLITGLNVWGEPRGYLPAGPEGGYLLRRDPDTVLAPDLSLDAPGTVAESDHGFPDQPPLLAVEVLSPDNTRREIERKVDIYLGAGVALVWVVDPGRRTVTVHRPGGESRVLGEGDVPDGGEVLPGFAMPLGRLFG